VNPPYLCFIDLKKVYDSVWRERLFRKMEQEGVPVKLVRQVRVWYQGVSVKVKVNDVLSSSFETKVGVRQGDGRELGDLLIPVLLFADDMVLMGDGEEELERIVAKVKDYSEEWRLDVNVSKSKEIVVSQNGEKVAKVKYGEEKLEYVNQYVYLGTVFSSNGEWETEVERRRQTGKALLCSLNKQVIWNRKFP
jgi:hypothetical protein